jgi:hypothetical protein
MAGISTLGTTYDLPNYHGELIQTSPEDTPFLTAIGGLSLERLGGVRTTSSVTFEWETYDLRDAANDRQRVEGADAPTVDTRVRGNVTNQVEIHQEKVEVSYTKQAAVAQYATGNAGGPGGGNPVQDEFGFQIDAALRAKRRDIEKGFIQNTGVAATTNATARKTKGLLEIISTNVVAKASTPTLTATDVLDLLHKVWKNGGIQEAETATLMCNAGQKRIITKLFVTDAGYAEASRNVGGVNVQTIETDFGRLNVMLNRYMPTTQVAVASLEECAPVFLAIPGKGLLFYEELARTGAAYKGQLYGEVGLQYGNEKAHGKITGLLDPYSAV